MQSAKSYVPKIRDVPNTTGFTRKELINWKINGPFAVFASISGSHRRARWLEI